MILTFPPLILVTPPLNAFLLLITGRDVISPTANLNNYPPTGHQHKYHPDQHVLYRYTNICTYLKKNHISATQKTNINNNDK